MMSFMAEKERERERDNNSSRSRNIKNKSVLYNYSNIKLQEIRRYNNDGLRSALSKSTELQFINPLVLKRGQRVPARNTCSPIWTISLRFVSMPERRISVEEKILCHIFVEKIKDLFSVNHTVLRLRYLEEVGRSSCVT